MSRRDWLTVLIVALLAGSAYAGWTYLGGFAGAITGMIIILVVSFGVAGAILLAADGNGKQAMAILFGVVLAVGVILLFLWQWNLKHMPKNNDAPLPVECAQVMTTLGYASNTPCLTSREGWMSFIQAQSIMSEVGNRDWTGELTTTLLAPCPTTCTEGNCTCQLDQIGFAVLYGQYQVQLNAAIQAQLALDAAKQAQENGQTDPNAPTFPDMAGKLMLAGGLMAFLNFWVAIPILVKSVPGSKISASLVFLVVMVVISSSDLWGTFSLFLFGGSDAGIVRSLIWYGLLSQVGMILLGLILFAVGMGIGALVTKSKTGGWIFGVIASLLTFAVGGFGILPGMINTLLVVSSGIDPWTATKAVFFGQSILLPGITSLIGVVWTLFSTAGAAMRFHEALEKV